MGPVTQFKSVGVPARPCFTSDLNADPLTDVKHPQDDYTESVPDCCNFRYILPVGNSNKLGKN